MTYIPMPMYYPMYYHPFSFDSVLAGMVCVLGIVAALIGMLIFCLFIVWDTIGDAPNWLFPGCVILLCGGTFFTLLGLILEIIVEVLT
jgi:hypothetical protein